MTTLAAQPEMRVIAPAEQATGLNWRTCSSSSVDEGLHLWRQLHTRIENQAITTHPSWIKSWINHYGDLVPHRFLIAESDGIVRGIALMTDGVGKKNGPFPVRSLHLGTAGEPQVGSVCVEYNRLLVEPEHEAEFVNGLAHTISNNPTWEEFCLDGVAESELTLWMKQFPNASVRSRDSKYFDFNEARDGQGEILALLGKSTRSNIRRRLKKYGELKTTWATKISEYEEIFAELVELHQARWNAVGEAGAFANSRFLNFQTQLLKRLVQEEKVVLFRVQHEEETVGALMLLVDQNRMLDYLSGFADFKEKPSIGLITHYLCMEEGLKRGFDAYDFLVGEKQHKDNLSTHTNQLCWLSYSRPSMKNSTMKTLRKVKHFMGTTSLFS